MLGTGVFAFVPLHHKHLRQLFESLAIFFDWFLLPHKLPVMKHNLACVVNSISPIVTSGPVVEQPPREAEPQLVNAEDGACSPDRSGCLEKDAKETSEAIWPIFPFRIVGLFIS